MSRRFISIVMTSALVAAALMFPAQAQSAEAVEAPKVMAGYGQADATWHVGAAAGQYAGESEDQGNVIAGGDVDPHNHALKSTNSYGVQSRLSYRAIVVQDGEGDQVAFVKSDSYLAQDYLARRVGQILAAEGSEIAYEEIFHMASHNHSSPYYQSPSWGVWVFQDVFDARAFEYHARQMAAAILAAEDALVPARMGATTVEHRLFKGMIQRKGLADDGTPRGYPADFGDMGLSVIRFDSLEDPKDPQPLATMINWGQHPEGLNGHALLSGDYIAPLERIVERATGAPLVFGQGDVGSAEQGPGRPDLVPEGIPTEWNHAGFAQTERGAYLLGRDVVKGYDEIEDGNPLVEFSSDFDVEAGNAFVPGPLSHPYPSVANCRTETTAEGNPGATGPPECLHAMEPNESSRANMMFENLRKHGIPIPENYDIPAFTGLEENLRLKLQAFKLGEVLLASCACEAQVDLILNLESRADEAQNNIWDGFDWAEELNCEQETPGGDWLCDDFNTGQRNYRFSDARYQRMQAQVHNDAAGWDSPEYVPYANSEPGDPTEIKGNFTKEELPADLGYKLPIGVGHASDYNGYTVSYREYMTWDDYRKSLTAYGPHTADYMVTRLVRLAGELNGGPELAAELHEPFAQADEVRQIAASTALGQATSAEYEAWRASLPNDVGPAAVITEPEDIQRFDAATFSWRGGSNAVDNPTVRVERLVNGEWEEFADQSGEIQTKVEFPQGTEGFLNTFAGQEEWIWTANFEAFDAFPRQIGGTPDGTYRFVVDGTIRQEFADEPYHFESTTFEVRPWDGLEVNDVQVNESEVSFVVPNPTYPQTYDSVFPYVAVDMRNDREGQPFCQTCSFRPWATGASVDSASVTIVRKGGKVEEVRATRGQDGRWHAPMTLYVGDKAYVDRAGATDTYGEINGARSDVVNGVVRRPTKLGLTVLGKGRKQTAHLYLTGQGEPLANRTIDLFADGRHFATVVTGTNGRATQTLGPRNRGASVYTANFAGDDEYLPVTGRFSR